MDEVKRKEPKTWITQTWAYTRVVDQCIGKHGHWLFVVVFTTAQQAGWAWICLF